MATPKPGEIRCPTCHRSTAPAAYCTQCGSAIPSDARIRPRGMDREELQDRIRQRRSGGDPYRRGATADEGAYTGYERFEPEPEDARARRAPRAGERRHDAFVDAPPPVVPPPAASEPPDTPADPRGASLVPPIESRPDVTRDSEDWVRPTPAATAAPPPTMAPPPSDVRVQEIEEMPYPSEAYEDAYDDEEGYPYGHAWERDHERSSSGAGAFAVLGFLALGVLALVGGAVLAGVFGDDQGGGVAADPTATPVASISASAAPSASESTAPSGDPSSEAPSASPAESGDPVVFPDGFTAEAQPCLPGSAAASGCSSNGSSNGGVVDIWVGFERGNARDVIGAAVVAPDGTTVGEGTIDLARIGCGSACNGWTYFPFRNLGPGTYEVRITRNGERASETSFEVS